MIREWFSRKRQARQISTEPVRSVEKHQQGKQNAQPPPKVHLFEGNKQMTHAGDMQLNKLNYDREREVLEFVIRRSLGETAIVINGEVPVMIINQGDLRQFAKAAIRQALLDAAEALAEAEEGEPAE